MTNEKYWENDEVLKMLNVLSGVKHHTFEYKAQFYYGVSEIHTVFSHCGVIYNRLLNPFDHEDICSDHYVYNPNGYIFTSEIQNWFNHIEGIYMANLEETDKTNYIYFHGHTLKLCHCESEHTVVLQLLKGKEIIGVKLVEFEY